MFDYLLISIHAKYLTLCLILIIISLMGDQLLRINRTSFNSYLIAISDSLIHGLIAQMSWFLICVSKGALIGDHMVVVQSIICGITASLIDFDHIIEAQSFDLKLIYGLESRPFLHNSSLTIIISLIIIILGSISHNWMFQTFGWIFLTASFTHHLRDALRHGFWFKPFNTKPVPFWTYVLILILYPLICSWIWNIMDIITQQLVDRNSIHSQIKYSIVKTEDV